MHRIFPRSRRIRGLLACVPLTLCVLNGCARVPASTVANELARAQVLAMLQTLNADLLSHDSATLTLEHWCSVHRLAEPARIVAKRIRDAEKSVPFDLRERLAIDAAEPLAYRHVQLMCGAHVLSEADNWYVPARLTADMNRRLQTSDEPFGKVVQALGFQRRTLAAQLLWSPLPIDWELFPATASLEPLRIPQALLRHQAILYTSAQQPFSAVVETYTNELFDFAGWSVYRDIPTTR